MDTQAKISTVNPFARNLNIARQHVIETYTDTIEIEMTGHRHCGNTVFVEVTFSEERTGERDICRIRPFEYQREFEITDFDILPRPIGRTTKRIYQELPLWFLTKLADCIDVDSLSKEG